MKEFRISGNGTAATMRIVSALPYGTVVKHAGRPCLVMYDPDSHANRGLVSLENPCCTWTGMSKSLEVEVLGKLTVTLADFK